jgi:hypothetical protein
MIWQSLKRYLRREPISAYDPAATKQRAQAALDVMDQAVRGEKHASTDRLSDAASDSASR